MLRGQKENRKEAKKIILRGKLWKHFVSMWNQISWLWVMFSGRFWYEQYRGFSFCYSSLIQL